jgi:hypothetical protein
MLRTTPLSYGNIVPFIIVSRARLSGQTAEPIFTLNGSNDSVWCKEDPFGGHFATKKILRVIISQNRHFSDPVAISSQIEIVE